VDNLTQIMGRRLADPEIEGKLNAGRKRVDIKFSNVDQAGFFKNLNELYHIQCPKIFVECKNYKNDPANPEFDQLQGRFGKKRGMFGILVCRSVDDRPLLLQRCRDAFHQDRGYIIVLDDGDIEKLLIMKDAADEAGIDAYLKALLDQLIM
jgi:hypothetical protein